jgi:hypothetical protein
MGKGAGDHELGRSFAVSNLSIQAIDTTFSWTEPTFPEKLFEDLDLLLKVTFFKETYIRWNERHSCAFLHLSNFFSEGRGKWQNSLLLISYHKILWNSIKMRKEYQ